MKTITLEYLKSLNACEFQLKIFKTTFGDKMELTKSNWELALAKHLEVSWWGYTMFTDNQQEKYQKTIQHEKEKYQKATQLEWEKYQNKLNWLIFDILTDKD